MDSYGVWIGVEVLFCWNYFGWGFIFFNIFIFIVEEIGLIGGIGDFVLE